jgi:hypothetical protein
MGIELAQDSDALRAEFEAWALEKKMAYRDKHGIWFYPEWMGGYGVWIGYRAASAARGEEVRRLREALEALLAERSPAARLSIAFLLARAALKGEQA